MADDPNPTLRAELLAAVAVLAPQIRGLHDLSTVSISAELRATISAQIADRERRRDLVQAVLNCLDQTLAALKLLEQDGYPQLPVTTLLQSQFLELQDEAGDLRAAVAVFQADAAAKLTIELGQPADKSSAVT